MRPQHIYIKEKDAGIKYGNYQLILSTNRSVGVCSGFINHPSKDDDLYLNVIKRVNNDETQGTDRDFIFEYCYDCSQSYLTTLSGETYDIKEASKTEDLDTKQKKDFISMFFVELARAKSGATEPSKQDIVEQIKLQTQHQKEKQEGVLNEQEQKGYVSNLDEEKQKINQNFLDAYEAFRKNNPNVDVSFFKKKYGGTYFGDINDIEIGKKETKTDKPNEILCSVCNRGKKTIDGKLEGFFLDEKTNKIYCPEHAEQLKQSETKQVEKEVVSEQKQEDQPTKKTKVEWLDTVNPANGKTYREILREQERQQHGKEVREETLDGQCHKCGEKPSIFEQLGDLIRCKDMALCEKVSQLKLQWDEKLRKDINKHKSEPCLNCNCGKRIENLELSMVVVYDKLIADLNKEKKRVKNEGICEECKVPITSYNGVMFPESSLCVNCWNKLDKPTQEKLREKWLDTPNTKFVGSPTNRELFEKEKEFDEAEDKMDNQRVCFYCKKGAKGSCSYHVVKGNRCCNECFKKLPTELRPIIPSFFNEKELELWKEMDRNQQLEHIEKIEKEKRHKYGFCKQCNKEEWLLIFMDGGYCADCWKFQEEALESGIRTNQRWVDIRCDCQPCNNRKRLSSYSTKELMIEIQDRRDFERLITWEDDGFISRFQELIVELTYSEDFEKQQEKEIHEDLFERDKMSQRKKYSKGT